jgi:hypothetical protein
MVVAGEGDSLVYVTLIEAAVETGESLEILRRAVREQQIKGVRENPENKRSRWLVALEDVRKFSQAESNKASTKAGVVSSDIEKIAPAEHDGGSDSVRSESVHTETQDSSDLSLSVDEIRDEEPIDTVLDQPVTDVPHLPSSVREPPTGSIVTVGPGRGEELLNRLTQSIDRFSDNMPEAPFDYQALLDKYVMAVEERAEAEVQRTTLQRRLDDLRDQVATHTEHLDQAQAQNRQLLAELEVARAELDAALNRSQVDNSRPLWKRRKRQ